MLALLAAALLLTFDIACQQAGEDEDETAKAPAAAACAADAKPAKLDLTLKDMNGGDVALASFPGKVLLINFWATWCAPCMAEMPHFVELQSQYKDDLQILGVSVDDNAEDMKPFAEKLKINYPLLVGLNRTDVEEAYGPFLGIPQTFVISRDGKICYKHAGIAPKQKFEAEIKSLL